MKTKLLQIVSTTLMFAGAVLLFQRPAFAFYADPGTGLLAIQAIGSALVASGWYLRRKIYNLIHRGGASKIESSKFQIHQEDESSSLS